MVVNEGIDKDHSSIPSLTTMIKKPEQRHYHIKQNDRRLHPTSTQSSVFKRNSIPQPGNRPTSSHQKQITNNPQSIPSKIKQINHKSTPQNKFTMCKICGRTNHRTIDCY